MQSIGLHAYGMYFIHMLVLMTIGQALMFHGILGYNNAAFYLIQIVLTIVISLTYVRIVARLPWGIGRYLV